MLMVSGDFLGWNQRKREVELVGAIGFEPTTPCAQGRCATRLRYAPTYIALLILNYFHEFAVTKPLTEAFVLLCFGSKLCQNCVKTH
jgi:hypothetical protein